MATFQLQTRRLLVAGGFAVAVVAAPGFVELLTDSERQRTLPVAQCPAGEEPDHFTATCVPHTVPNSPATPRGGFTSIPGNPDVPAVSLPGGGAIPCTVNIGQCIGLAEATNPVPRVPAESHVGGSPTVHGHVGHTG